MSEDTATAGNIANRFAALSVSDAGWDDAPQPQRRAWADMSDDEDEILEPTPAPAAAANPAPASKPAVRFARPTGKPSSDDGFQQVSRDRRPMRGGGGNRGGRGGGFAGRDDRNRGGFRDNNRGGFRDGNRDRDNHRPPRDNYEICSFNKLCPNPNCPKIHHKDRDISKVIIDPNREYCLFALNGAECTFKDCRMEHSVVCPDASECSVGGCILQHPEGHDPAKVECRRALECQNSHCVGKHPEGRQLPVCDFDPFCTRVGTTCNKRHTALNGKLRMVHSFCNYKVNMMECKHEKDCPYQDPNVYVCRDGARCRFRAQNKCGFLHDK